MFGKRNYKLPDLSQYPPHAYTLEFSPEFNMQPCFFLHTGVYFTHVHVGTKKAVTLTTI